MFYYNIYTLGNIRPVFRSSLQAIQLLGVAKSSDMNQSARDILLRNFVQCMKLLSTVSVAGSFLFFNITVTYL